MSYPNLTRLQYIIRDGIKSKKDREYLEHLYRELPYGVAEQLEQLYKRKVLNERKKK